MHIRERLNEALRERTGGAAALAEGKPASVSPNGAAAVRDCLFCRYRRAPAPAPEREAAHA